MHQSVRVRFREFWPGFDPNHFFVPLLRGMPNELDVVLVQSGAVDLEIVSVFAAQKSAWAHLQRGLARRLPPILRRHLDAPSAAIAPSDDARVSIWFTGENLRPAIGDWDLRLSFDGDSRTLANHYLPLWWLLFPELLWPAVSMGTGEHRLGRTVTIEEYLRPRTPVLLGRDRFACAFIGNPESLRMHAVRALSEIGTVDIFGPLTGNWVEAKQDVARHYRFELCFENSVTPGYVTEKAFDAWGSGAVPLWNGLDPHGYVNDAALINYATGAGMDEFCESVERLYRNDAAWISVASQPLLRRRPSLAAIRATIWERLVVARVVEAVS